MVKGQSMPVHVALAVALVLLFASRGLFAYSLCEDVSIGDQKIANPLKSESTPMTLVCNAELVTVSDDSAVITWVTNRSAPSKVDCWRIDGSDCTTSGDPGLYHAVEITDLAPGAIYYYRIDADGLPALPTLQSPGVFRTFDRPGTYLFSFASLNDMHVGEGISGQLTNQAGQPIPPSFRHDDPPYWKLMNEGAVAGINGTPGVAFTIVKGDLTGEGKPTQLGDAKTILDRLASPYFPIRGNHDKSLADFLGTFGDPRLDSRFSVNPASTTDAQSDPHLDYSFDRKVGDEILHFVALDTWDNDMPLPPPAPMQPPVKAGGGRFDADQLSWVDQDLSANSEKRTFLYMHHPTSEIASVTAVPPVIFTVREPDAAQFLQVIAKHPNVVGVLSGHTHRNWITGSVLAPGVPFVETAATKEYPGGYAIYKVFTGGYIQSFYKCATAECLAWSEQTRGEYLNLYPLYTSQIGARNGCFAYDFQSRKIAAPEVE